ncbi:Alcohol dehydrogenase GroES domain protein, partial [mine drainage metagenome]
MKAAIIREPFGLENLKIEDVRSPISKNGEVRVKINLAGVNPIDLNVIRNRTLYNMNPVPHVPGSEATGTVLEGSDTLKKGEQVIIYPRLF